MKWTWILNISPSVVRINNLNVKGRKTSLARAITDFVSHAPVICEEADQVVFDSGSILHLMLYEKKIMC